MLHGNGSGYVEAEAQESANTKKSLRDPKWVFGLMMLLGEYKKLFLNF